MPEPDRELKQLSYNQQQIFESEFGKNLKELINNKLQEEENIEIPDEYKLKSDKGNFRTNSKFVNKFINSCMNNENKSDKKNCASSFILDNDSNTIKYIENQLKDLRIDQLKRLAWQFELKKKSNGFYESADEWEKHIEFINIEIDKEGTISKNSQISGLLSGAYDEMDIDEFNNEPTERKLNYHKDVKSYKNLFINLMKVLSFRLNNQIRENMKKENKYSDVHSTYIKQSIQPSPIHNDAYILRSYSPYIPMLFYGGKYEFKPNNNQAADILKKLFDALVNNLKAQNKYLNEQDKKDVYAALDKIKQLETRIAELITNGYNFVQNNSDITQQKINLDKINTEIMKTNEKVVSLRQKIDYIITKLYNEQIEKDKKDDVVKKDFS